jgi:hypothetical protein
MARAFCSGVRAGGFGLGARGTVIGLLLLAVVVGRVIWSAVVGGAAGVVDAGRDLFPGGTAVAGRHGSPKCGWVVV